MKYVTFLFLFLSFNSFAQNDIHLINFSTDYSNEEPIIKMSFYIDSVIDGRKGVYKKLGTVMKGAFNREIEADFESPIIPLFKKYFDNVYGKNFNQTPIVLEIKRLNIDEKMLLSKEIGKAEIELIFYKKNIDGNLNEIFSKSFQISESRLDATKSHSVRIKKAIWNIFVNFNNFINQNEISGSSEASLSSSNNSDIKHSENDLIIYTKRNLGSSILDKTLRKTGIYKNFSEFQSNSPSSNLDTYTFDLTSQRIKLKLKNNKIVKEDYFGISVDGSIYLNANGYQNMAKNYYVKVLSEGPYFLISDDYVSAKDMNRKALVGGLALGVTGALIANSIVLDNDIICLDIQSGQFIPVNEKNIINLIESDSELTTNFLSQLNRYNTGSYFFILNDFNNRQNKKTK
jgi:hypothetical protein